jgi:hypothetical protein
LRCNQLARLQMQNCIWVLFTVAPFAFVFF